MSSLTTRKKEEKQKRIKFLGTEGFGLFATLFWTPWIGIPLMALGAYWGWEWFQYRVKNSMRF